MGHTVKFTSNNICKTTNPFWGICFRSVGIEYTYNRRVTSYLKAVGTISGIDIDDKNCFTSMALSLLLMNSRKEVIPVTSAVSCAVPLTNEEPLLLEYHTDLISTRGVYISTQLEA